MRYDQNDPLKESSDKSSDHNYNNNYNTSKGRQEEES